MSNIQYRACTTDDIDTALELWDAATGGNSVWTETQTVNLYNGRFSVGLGSATSLTSTILDAEKIRLSMTVIDTDSQGNPVEVELSGRQAIEPAPFAAWSMNSASMVLPAPPWDSRTMLRNRSGVMLTIPFSFRRCLFADAYNELIRL